MKRLLGISLVCLLASSVLVSGCSDSNQTSGTTGEGTKNGTKDDSQRKISLRTITEDQGGQTPEENKLFEDEVKRLSGIEISINRSKADYKKKLLAAVAAGEKFDLFYAVKESMDVLVEQKALMPLDDLIKKSKVFSDPNVISESEWDMVRYDGKIYGIFNKKEGGTMPLVRKDWLDKLKLQEPKTLDEYYNVLKAFKEQDPDGNKKDDTYGLSTAGLYDIQPFMSATGVKARYVITADGKRTIPYATEQAVPVFEWFNKLFKEGILDPNFATNDSGKMRSMFQTDRVGMITYWDAWTGMFNNMFKQEDPNTTKLVVGINGVPGPDGKVMLRRGDPSTWVIPANSPDPEGAMKYLEFLYTDAGIRLATMGIEGHDYNVVDGKYVLTEEGKKHQTHGGGTSYNKNYKDPVEESDVTKAAKEIVLNANSSTELSTNKWNDAKKIVENYAFQAIMGKLPSKEAVQKMHDELLAAKLIDQ